MAPSRPNPAGGWGLRAISLSFVVNDATASPPPLFAISPRKTHPQTSPYLRKGALSFHVRSPRRQLFPAVLAPLLLVVVTLPLLFWRAEGHTFGFTDVHISLTPNRFQVELTCDLDALAMGVAHTTDSQLLADTLSHMPQREFDERVTQLRELLRRRIRVRIDGTASAFEIRFPQLRPDRRIEDKSVVGTVAKLDGTIAGNARELTFFASRAFPPVRLVVTHPQGTRLSSLVLDRGEESPPVSIRSLQEPAWPSGLFVRYLSLGFTHILPSGMDHVLFVLGLFLSGIGLAPLLWQVSTFTAAHTLSLALGIYGVVTLPRRPVEALIALSIAWVALENLLGRPVGRLRLTVVFVFGLLHGLGFAGAISGLGLPAGEKALTLFSFNLGVEFGQLSVIGLAFLLCWPFRSSPASFRKLSILASTLIGCLGLIWFWQRLLERT